MLIGIDVGGTFTDAVVIADKHIVAWAKQRTTKENLLEGILSVLDALSPHIKVEQVERVILSTTVLTNLIVEGKEEPVDLYIIPGPGAVITDYLPVVPTILGGYTDHRGRVTAKTKIESSIRRNHDKAAVSAKFAVRNPQSEIETGEALAKTGYTFVSRGAHLHGNLNFVRRTVSAYYNSAVQQGFLTFKKSVEQALVERHIQAPLYILKADGGSLPVDVVSERPVEAIFTGPAATVLGLEALGEMPKGMAVALDIGGTTTDISLWKGGKPLMARGGANILQYPSAVRAFAVSSIGIGGESEVWWNEAGTLQVGPIRKGPSMALGGKVPTLGDALIVGKRVSFGDAKQAEQALKLLQTQAPQNASVYQDIGVLAEEIIKVAIARIQQGIEDAIEGENKRPIYVVEDIIADKPFTLEALAVVGGTAKALGQDLERYYHVPVIIPPAAAVANAVGAAVAKETFHLTLRADTQTRTLVIPELGIRESTSLQTPEELRLQVQRRLQETAESLGLEADGQGEIIYEEAFSMIEGWQSIHKLLTVVIQLQAGVRYHVNS